MLPEQAPEQEAPQSPPPELDRPPAANKRLALNGVPQVLPGGSDLRVALSHVLSIPRRVLVAGVFGLLLGALPAALLANRAGEAMVTRPCGTRDVTTSPRANMAYHGWTSEVPECVERGAFLAFDVFRVGVISVASTASLVAMMIVWRGAQALRSSRLFWALLLLRETLIVAGGCTKGVLLSYGVLAPRTWTVYLLQAPAYLAHLFVTPACMVALAPAGGHGRTACVGLMYQSHLVAAIFVSGLLTRRYLETSRMWTRVLVAFCNSSVLFSFNLSLARWTARQFPGANDRLTLLAMTPLVTIPIMGTWIMQGGTQDLTTTLLLNLLVAFREVGQHLMLLRGITDVEAARHVLRSLLGGCTRHPKPEPKEPESIFWAQPRNAAETAQAASVGGALHQSERGPRAAPEDGQGAGPPAPLFVAVVGMLNSLELLSLLIFTLVQFVAKRNPEVIAGEPLGWRHNLSRFLLCLGTELFCDCITASYASKWAVSGAGGKGQFMMLFGTSLKVTIVGALTGVLVVTRSLAFMCPAARSGTGEPLVFKSLGQCAN